MKRKQIKGKKKMSRFVKFILIFLIGYEVIINRVQIRNVKSGSVHFKDDNIDITKELNKEDLKTIKRIFMENCYILTFYCWSREDSSISHDDGERFTIFL